jgi:hypothetical protein
MAQASERIGADVCDNVWCFLAAIYREGGVGILCFLFISFIFYRLVWKVWSAAMKSKNDEIERLVEERNFLQDKVFSGRLTSDTRPVDSED